MGGTTDRYTIVVLTSKGRPDLGPRVEEAANPVVYPPEPPEQRQQSSLFKSGLGRSGGGWG